MNAALPKQFLQLAGTPVLVHTVSRVLELENVCDVVIALPRAHVATARQVLSRRAWAVPVRCVPGGPTRQESVRRGVVAVRGKPEVILVHDAVRPLCDAPTMRRVIEAAWRHGGAVPGLPATETIQRVSHAGRVLRTPPRDELFAIQTPQCFRSEVLRGALESARKAGFNGTDESSVARWAGHAVYVVEGSPENIKITRPLDLEIAELIMKKRRGHSSPPGPVCTGEPDRPTREVRNVPMRVGQGIDYHRLVEGRKLVLGGLEIPFEKGLLGHSDADALIHAICDALLGAAGLGDIGRHFPDTDPANRDRPSLEFLRGIRGLLEQDGWSVTNVDATILAQRPKLAPFMDGMRQNIAAALGIDVAAVSVKATTTEGLNAEGRGEGISAFAVAAICAFRSAVP
jgi:2-C-methyl-D-erythritol 4-phosphate cytidylyltransferase / 2-C-methyl-D-erythritol 2,4-cyclodiphosphate synthase